MPAVVETSYTTPVYFSRRAAMPSATASISCIACCCRVRAFLLTWSCGSISWFIVRSLVVVASLLLVVSGAAFCSVRGFEWVSSCGFGGFQPLPPRRLPVFENIHLRAHHVILSRIIWMVPLGRRIACDGSCQRTTSAAWWMGCG